MRLYNTGTGKIEDFRPWDPPQVKMYTCGPTVYDYVSIGNFRAFVTADILHRGLLAEGYKVDYVMNITDVGHLTTDADTGEDKLEKGARREGKSPLEIARFYEEDFLGRSADLNILPAQRYCRATENIEAMIDLIKVLEKKGYTYVTKNGVYFDVSKFPDYEELSGCSTQDLLEGAREEVHRDETKKHPCDFRLWQLNQPDHILQWDSPWGTGYPGWHIECSAMSMRYLGEKLDIHTGGRDLIFPHHTNEIAQSEAATGERFVKYWVHNNFLMVDGGKMSKSLGNAYTLDDLGEKGVAPLSLRYFYLTAHYRSTINFTWEGVEAAQRGLTALRRKVSYWTSAEESGLTLGKDNAGADLSDRANEFDERFRMAIGDDLDTPRALAIVWEMADSTLKNNEKLDLVRKWEGNLGLRLDRPLLKLVSVEDLDKRARELVEQREALRKKEDYAEADRLRGRLENLGFELEDTADGLRLWKRQDEF